MTVPTPSSTGIVVMDSFSCHKMAGVCDAIVSADACVFYLPSYSQNLIRTVLEIQSIPELRWHQNHRRLWVCIGRLQTNVATTSDIADTMKTDSESVLEAKQFRADWIYSRKLRDRLSGMPRVVFHLVNSVSSLDQVRSRLNRCYNTA